METNKEEIQANTTTKRALLVINCIILCIGNTAGPLIMRLYFLHGGTRVWLSSWLETAGWPVTLIPLTISYFRRRAANNAAKYFLMKPPLFIAAVIIGILTGLDNYFYAYGMARLPVSTSALIIAAQLIFIAGFGFLLVKQKFTFYSINAVILLTVGAGVLALHTKSDRPANESNRQYVLGFVMTVAAAVLYGFILPAVELTYKKAKQEISYTLVLEVQAVMCLFATVFATLGMLAHKDFKVIAREANEFELGKAVYCVVLVFSAIIWQGFFLGGIGLIFCSSSLLSGVIVSLLLPVQEVLAVIFYKEKFTPEKGVALILSLWGFVSYFYGEAKQNKKKTIPADSETDMPPQSPKPIGSII